MIVHTRGVLGMMWLRKKLKDESGSALLAALAAMLILDAFAVAVLALTTTQLNATARDKRSSDSLNVAESGVNAAFWKIDNRSNYSPLESSPDAGTTDAGEYEIVMEDVDGTENQKKVTVTGYAPSKTSEYPKPVKRRIEVTIEVAPRVLRYGMYAFSWIDIQGATARTYMAPIDYTAPGAQGGDMGSNYPIQFNDSGIQMNNRGTKVGEQATYDALFGNPPVQMGNLVTAGPDSYVWAVNQEVATIAELQAKCSKILMNSIDHMTDSMDFPILNFEGPPYDASFKAMAAANDSNGALNSSSGNGVYTREDFETIVLDSGKDITLTGMIYIDGELIMTGQGKNLTIEDGGLVIKDDPNDSDLGLEIGNQGSLRILHGTEESKKYPGLCVYTSSGEIAESKNRGSMEIEGLVYSEKTYTEANSTVRIKGALLASGTSADASIVNQNASIIIQYDPAITSMYGIQQMGDLFVSKVMRWREVSPN